MSLQKALRSFDWKAMFLEQCCRLDINYFYEINENCNLQMRFIAVSPGVNNHLLNNICTAGVVYLSKTTSSCSSFMKVLWRVFHQKTETISKYPDRKDFTGKQYLYVTWQNIWYFYFEERLADIFFSWRHSDQEAKLTETHHRVCMARLCRNKPE